MDTRRTFCVSCGPSKVCVLQDEGPLVISLQLVYLLLEQLRDRPYRDNRGKGRRDTL